MNRRLGCEIGTNRKENLTRKIRLALKNEQKNCDNPAQSAINFTITALDSRVFSFCFVWGVLQLSITKLGAPQVNEILGVSATRGAYRWPVTNLTPKHNVFALNARHFTQQYTTLHAQLETHGYPKMTPPRTDSMRAILLDNNRKLRLSAKMHERNRT